MTPARGIAPRAAPASGFRVVRFLVVFVALYALYRAAAGTALERFVVDTLTVRPAAGWLALLLPDANVHASGDRIVADGGGVRVLPGCEGIDVAFLLIAAFAAAPLGARARLIGIGCGLAVVFVLNQLRLGWLLFAWRADPAWFALSHALLAPLALVAGVAFWFRRFTRRHGAAGPP